MRCGADEMETQIQKQNTCTSMITPWNDIEIVFIIILSSRELFFLSWTFFFFCIYTIAVSDVTESRMHFLKSLCFVYFFIMTSEFCWLTCIVLFYMDFTWMFKGYRIFYTIDILDCKLLVDWDDRWPKYMNDRKAAWFAVFRVHMEWFLEW
jgi:hypothetical protein